MDRDEGFLQGTFQGQFKVALIFLITKSYKLFFRILICYQVVGHRSIVEKSSAYGAKGPGFKTQWRKKIYLCHCVFICSVKRIVINKRAVIGAYLKKICYQVCEFRILQVHPMGSAKLIGSTLSFGSRGSWFKSQWKKKKILLLLSCVLDLQT